MQLGLHAMITLKSVYFFLLAVGEICSFESMCQHEKKNLLILGT